MLRGFLFSILAMVLLPVAKAQPQPPIEAYGDLPKTRLAALSPSGDKIAFINITPDGKEAMAVYETEKGFTTAVGTSDVVVRNLFFAGDNHVILKASETTTMYGYSGRFEYSAAFAINLKKKKVRQLLKGTDGLYPAQSGLGRILAYSAGSTEVFMPAHMGQSDPNYDLLRVDLDKGRGRRVARGRSSTMDWIVGTDGTIYAREDYSNKQNKYEVYTGVSGKMVQIYEDNAAARPPFSLHGVKHDKSALILVARDKKGGFQQMREMDFEGNISEPILQRDDADIDSIFLSSDRVVEGVRYSGAFPSYEFFDPALDKDIETLLAKLPGSSVSIVDWSDDWSKVLLLLDSSMTAGKYILYDRATQDFKGIISRRPDIPAEALGALAAISYPARDGLEIPAILTFPPGLNAQSQSKLPLIVMPHGGPESYDNMSFDWMAQYFANRGYLVLQPNFRGSAGYGQEFVLAGNGEWGGKMQDDVTDGVKALIDGGYADADRVCIAGASYGGYAALAGGAFTPDLYKCVIAIAPVSDIPKMLSDVKRDRGRYHWALDYWEERIANGKTGKDKLRAISPANYPESFQAPVLLIHGKDDTVVPIKQSDIMRDALRREKKDVEFITLKGEDHWLSEGPNRLATLKAMDAFITEHIGE